MKWKIHLFDNRQNREICCSDEMPFEEADNAVRVLSKPSMFGNKKNFSIMLEPIDKESEVMKNV